MFYVIYKITNTVNGKIYIGCHKTTNVNDGYMGSGKHLIRSQKKYGIEHFEKEILEVFDNQEQMFKMESLIVNKTFVERTDTYNIKCGGHGGFDHINNNQLLQINNCKKGMETALKNGLHEKANAKLALLRKDPIWVEKNKIKRSISTQMYFANGGVGSFKGKTHSEETKLKMSISAKGKRYGENNSQFGTMWIYHPIYKLNKKIKREQFHEYEQAGWLKGRKIKTW